MGQILLTPEEIYNATRGKEGYDNNIAKSQLKKVRGKIAVVEIPKGKSAGYNVDGKQYIALSMLQEDWETMLKELEE